VRLLPAAILAGAAIAAVAVAVLVVDRRPPPPTPVTPVPARPRPVIQPLPAPQHGFSGRWAGPCSLTTKCPGEPQSVDEDQLEIAISTEGTTLAVTRDECTYQFDLRRKTAVLRPGQRCAAGPDLESWTLALQTDDQELVANVTSRSSAAPGITCTSRMRGVLTRH
jgi:hypothetical protein